MPIIGIENQTATDVELGTLEVGETFSLNGAVFMVLTSEDSRAGHTRCVVLWSGTYHTGGELSIEDTRPVRRVDVTLNVKEA